LIEYFALLFLSSLLEWGLNQAVNATKGLLNDKIEALSNLSEDDFSYVFDKNLIKLAQFDPESTTVLDIVNKTQCFTDPGMLNNFIAIIY